MGVEPDVKSKKQLTDARAVIEGMRPGIASNATASSSVHVENTTFVYMNQQKEVLKPTLTDKRTC